MQFLAAWNWKRCIENIIHSVSLADEHYVTFILNRRLLLRGMLRILLGWEFLASRGPLRRCAAMNFQGQESNP